MPWCPGMMKMDEIITRSFSGSRSRLTRVRESAAGVRSVRRCVRVPLPTGERPRYRERCVRSVVAAGAGRLWVRGEDRAGTARDVSSTGLLIPYGVTFRNSAAWNGIHGFTPPQPAPLL